MIPCQNCGKLNNGESNFCRFCGTKFTVQQPAPPPRDPYNYSPPRPYAWKTDEFQTQTEPRPTARVQAPTQAFDPVRYQPAPLAHNAPPGTHVAFSCPHCASWAPPRIERRISTAGWITFAVLLVLFFPLFWIGLLIKEEVQICPTCNLKIDRPQLYR